LLLGADQLSFFVFFIFVAKCKWWALFAAACDLNVLLPDSLLAVVLSAMLYHFFFFAAFSFTILVNFSLAAVCLADGFAMCYPFSVCF
jgi:hypothetical protein